MSGKSNNEKKSVHKQPVLDFISGDTHSGTAKRLTSKVRNIRELWLLSKMGRDVQSHVTGLDSPCSVKPADAKL